MKKKLRLSILLLLLLLIYSCNMSDVYEKLPFGGYEVFWEGGYCNRLIKNHHMIIDNGLVDCKYNDDYMLVSVDTTYSRHLETIKKQNLNLKYFIQDLKKDTIIREISYSNLKKLIKEKSLDDIDITKYSYNNMSDVYEELPFGGYILISAGLGYHSLMKNHHMIIDNGIIDCKYNDDYMLISVYTNYTWYPQTTLGKQNLKYFIQDLKKDTIIRKISYGDLKKLIKEKSLDDIDVTKGSEHHSID